MLELLEVRSSRRVLELDEVIVDLLEGNNRADAVLVDEWYDGASFIGQLLHPSRRACRGTCSGNDAVIGRSPRKSLVTEVVVRARRDAANTLMSVRAPEGLPGSPSPNESPAGRRRVQGRVTTVACVAFGPALVAVATAVLVAEGADLRVAMSVLSLTVVCASVLGYAPGIAAAVASFLALNYYFTQPFHSFAIYRTDDLVSLVVSVTIAMIVGAAVARLNKLRLRARLAAATRWLPG
jgi:K+-sensing histidine kinase KdpD